MRENSENFTENSELFWRISECTHRNFKGLAARFMPFALKAAAVFFEFDFADSRIVVDTR